MAMRNDFAGYPRTILSIRCKTDSWERSCLVVKLIVADSQHRNTSRELKEQKAEGFFL